MTTQANLRILTRFTIENGPPVAANSIPNGTRKADTIGTIEAIAMVRTTDA